MSLLVHMLYWTVLVTQALSVASDCTPSVKKRVRKTVNKNETLGTQNINNVEAQVQNKESEELINCKSIFSRTVKNDQITKFPLTNDARLDVDFEIPETGVISLLRDDPNVKFYSAYPSVTKIISDTMSNYSQSLLEKWKERMIKALGQEKFELMKQGQLNRGAEFHDNIRRILLGQDLKENTSEVVASSIKSLEHIWPLLNSTVAVESHIAHPQLGYRGVVDCVCKFRGTPVLVEWKLSEKLKPRLQHTYDAPIQLSAYLGAVNYDNSFKFQVNHGLVVVAYTSGVPADAFFLRPKICEHYWKLWLNRLKAYNQLHKNDHLLGETDAPLDFL